MSCQRAVYQWTEVVTTYMPHLSKPQAAVLALWSLGMVLARSCALSAVSEVLAVGLERKANTVRQQLREWCDEAKAKRGGPRQEFAVESSFAPLLGWVLSWWEGTQLAVAVDATTLGQRFVVLVISVLYRGCAIPVAWTVLPASEKPAWRSEWLRRLRQVRAVVPRRFFVIVLADRGLYAPLVISSDRALGLASAVTDQYGRDVSARGQGSVSVLARVGAAAGHAVGRGRHGVSGPAPPPQLYAAGTVGCGLCRSLVIID